MLLSWPVWAGTPGAETATRSESQQKIPVSWPLGQDQGFPRGVSIMGTPSCPFPAMPTPPSPAVRQPAPTPAFPVALTRLSLRMSCRCSAPTSLRAPVGRASRRRRPLNRTHQLWAPPAASSLGFRSLSEGVTTGQRGNPSWSDLGYVSSQKASSTRSPQSAKALYRVWQHISGSRGMARGHNLGAIILSPTHICSSK